MKIFFEFKSKSSKGEIFILVAFIILIISARIYGILIKENFALRAACLKISLVFLPMRNFLRGAYGTKAVTKVVIPSVRFVITAFCERR